MACVTGHVPLRPVHRRREGGRTPRRRPWARSWPTYRWQIPLGQATRFWRWTAAPAYCAKPESKQSTIPMLVERSQVPGRPGDALPWVDGFMAPPRDARDGPITHGERQNRQHGPTQPNGAGEVEHTSTTRCTLRWGRSTPIDRGAAEPARDLRRALGGPLVIPPKPKEPTEGRRRRQRREARLSRTPS